MFVNSSTHSDEGETMKAPIDVVWDALDYVRLTETDERAYDLAADIFSKCLHDLAVEELKGMCQ